MNKYLFFIAASLPLLTATDLTAASPVAVQDPVGKHQSTNADNQAIRQLLDGYTHSVMSGDQKRFESLLLDLDIPFSSVEQVNKGGGTRNYAGFKAAIFDSGERFSQRFHNVRIEQDGDLAQVSLDFETTRIATRRGSYGWKVLHLLKVHGEWKIASEFYTAQTMPQSQH
ncbi:MAG: nuclear transport factor 2 family protein [Tahibacter sp.]